MRLQSSCHQILWHTQATKKTKKNGAELGIEPRTSCIYAVCPYDVVRQVGDVVRNETYKAGIIRLDHTAVL
jgi:hypothetical protein